MATNCTTGTALGEVRRLWTGSDPGFNAPTETQHTLLAPAVLMPGIPVYHHKVVSQLVVEMTQGEKDDVDDVQPTNGTQRRTHMAEETRDGSSNQSVLNSAWTVKPLKAGDYQLVVTCEAQMAAVATWGASGPDRTLRLQLTRNFVEIATWDWPFATYRGVNYTGSFSHNEGDEPRFDLLVNMAAATADVQVRRIRMTVSPIAAALFEENEV